MQPRTFDSPWYYGNTHSVRAPLLMLAALAVRLATEEKQAAEAAMIEERKTRGFSHRSTPAEDRYTIACSRKIGAAYLKDRAERRYQQERREATPIRERQALAATLASQIDAQIIAPRPATERLPVATEPTPWFSPVKVPDIQISWR